MVFIGVGAASFASTVYRWFLADVQDDLGRFSYVYKYTLVEGFSVPERATWEVSPREAVADWSLYSRVALRLFYISHTHAWEDSTWNQVEHFVFFFVAVFSSALLLHVLFLL